MKLELTWAGRAGRGVANARLERVGAEPGAGGRAVFRKGGAWLQGAGHRGGAGPTEPLVAERGALAAWRLHSPGALPANALPCLPP